MKALKSLLLSFVLALLVTSAAFAFSPKTVYTRSATALIGSNPQKFTELTALPATTGILIKAPQIKRGTLVRPSHTGFTGNGDSAFLPTSGFRDYPACPAQALACYSGLPISFPKRFAVSSASPRAPPL